jgi:amino acid adenylation domain-containing protein
MIYLLPHAVDTVASSHPDRVAFSCLQEHLTYEQLATRSNRLAVFLLADGVLPGERVGICLPRSLESVVAVFGILKAGAVYVPIDPLAPRPVVEGILRHCGIRHLIAAHRSSDILQQIINGGNTPLESVIGSLSLPGPVRTSPWATVEQASGGAAPDIRISELDLAYIMYTSGSTGSPKGIMHTHYSGLSYARLSAATYGIHPDDRIANHSPLHFDMSTLGYFTAPTAGCTTVIIPEAHTRMPASLSTLMEDERVTVWYSVPLALTQMLHQGALENRKLTSLRWVLFGGEPFPPRPLYELMRLWPQAQFSNVYGPAEVNQCTFYHLPPQVPDASDPVSQQPIPLGEIWPDTEALVLDETDQPVGAGQSGELVVRSPTMMQGYWARPDLNARAFFTREVFPNFTKTFYRTGDLVRLGEDLQLHFIGRKDRQIKLRGYRIDLDDVEHALAFHEAVAEAAVYVYSDVEGGDERLAAAVIPRTGMAPDSTKIMAFLATRLPPQALPGRLFIRNTFPLTGTGKIDRNALRKETQAELASGGEPPSQDPQISARIHET